MRTIVALACLVAAAAITATTPAAAYFQTGNSLEAACLTDDGPSGPCVAYVVGVVDGMWWGEPNMICFPEGVTQGQLTTVFAKYLREHPERMHLNAPVLVADALQPAFPCN